MSDTGKGSCPGDGGAKCDTGAEVRCRDLDSGRTVYTGEDRNSRAHLHRSCAERNMGADGFREAGAGELPGYTPVCRSCRKKPEGRGSRHVDDVDVPDGVETAADLPGDTRVFVAARGGAFHLYRKCARRSGGVPSEKRAGVVGSAEICNMCINKHRTGRRRSGQRKGSPSKGLRRKLEDMDPEDFPV